MPVGVVVHDRAGDQRPAALERHADALQLLGREGQLRLQVVELRRPGVREMTQEPRPALALQLHPRKLGAADRVEQRRDLVSDEEALAAVDGEDEVASSAKLPEPRELRGGPLAEAGLVMRVRLLVARLEKARERR